MILALPLLLGACALPDLAPPDPQDHASAVCSFNEVVRFVALGDTGTGSPVQRQVAEGIRSVCADRGCDFALLLGDNLYPDGMTSPDDPRMDERFSAIYNDLGLDVFAVLGNHDYGRRHLQANADHQLAWARKQPRFQMPGPYYRFHAGPDGFWALDTDAVFWAGLQPQADWLDQTLGSSRARWKVVFGHHPYRSDGKHGNAGSYEGWSYVPYLSGGALHTLFTQHVVGRADLYLSGHDHSLQVIAADGIALVVSGAGGSSEPLVDRGNQPVLAFAQPGFAWIELADDRMILALHAADGTPLGEHVVPHPGG